MVAYKQQAVPRKRGGLGIFYRSDPDLRHENERLSPNSYHEFLQCPCPARLRRAMTAVTGFVTIAGTRRVSVEPGRAIGSRRFQLTALEHHESTPFSSQAVVRRRLARRPGLRPRLRDAAAARAAVLAAPIVRRTTARRRSPVPRGRRIRAAPSGRLRRFGASAAPHRRARAAMSGRTATGAGPAADTYGFRAAGSRSAPGIAGSRLLATTGRRAALYRRTLELRARRAARRLPRKPRNASGNARRRRIAADEHRAPVFGAAICRTPLRAREGGPKMNQRRGKRARTPAAARGFLTTAPNDAIASIAGFHRP